LTARLAARACARAANFLAGRTAGAQAPSLGGQRQSGGDHVGVTRAPQSPPSPRRGEGWGEGAPASPYRTRNALVNAARASIENPGTPSPQPSPLTTSGLPDFVTNSAQVGQARLALARELACASSISENFSQTTCRSPARSPHGTFVRGRSRRRCPNLNDRPILPA
jgi:hypothetical protein